MKRCIIILMLLLAAQAFAAPLITSPYDWMYVDAQILAPTSFSPGVIGGGGSTWTLIQHPTNTTCTGTAGVGTLTCSVGSGQGLVSPTSGNLVVLVSQLFVSAQVSVPPAFASATGDAGLTHCPKQLANENYSSNNYVSTDCAYAPVATGGGTTFTYGWTTNSSGGSYGINVGLYEYHKSTGSPAIEAGNCSGGSGTNCFGISGACTACTGPTPSVTGTDVVINSNANENDCSAVASPYGTSPSPDFDHLNVFGVTDWSLSQSSGNPAVYTCTSGGAAMFTVAFK